MTATERLRALLDERGVEHYDGTENTLWLKDENGYRASANDLSDGLLQVHLWCTSPEQAVDATLGRGTCHDANVGGYFVCSECEALVKLHSIGRSYVDEWGKRWYATSNDHGFNFCPNCGRKVDA